MKVGHNQNKAVMYVEYKNSKKQKIPAKIRWFRVFDHRR